jgi:tRNA (cytidine/uridine-2'-O-)-methyltransferase
LKRAGLDYWSEIDLRYHESFEAFLEGKEEGRLIAFSSHGSEDYPAADVRRGDYLLFGKETKGLPRSIREAYPCYRIPMWGKVRSLNLSTAVGIVVYHYLHKIGRF